MEEHPLSLYELNALVKRSIHACLPDTYWLSLIHISEPTRPY